LQYLNAADYAVMILYFAVLLVMGFELKRRASRSMEDYFLGGKKLPWWMLGISGMGNFIDMTGTMVIVSFLYMLGPRGLYVEFRGGACLVLAFQMLWTGKWHRRSNCMTGAEWNIYRFGEGAGAQAARAITAVATIVFMIGMLAYLIKGAGLFLNMFMPFPPAWCAVVMVAVTIAYTVISGFYGVVYTDIFQCFIILAAVVVVCVVAVGRIAGYPGDLSALAAQVTGNAQWMSSVPHVRAQVFKGYEEFQPLLFVTFFYLLRTVIVGLGSGADSRYFGARNERECGILSFFWTWLMMFRWPMMISFAALGLFLVHRQFPDQRVLTEATTTIKQHFAAQTSGGRPEALTDPATLQAAIRPEMWEERTADIINGKHPALAEKLRVILGEQWNTKLYLVSYHGTVNPERILPAVLLFEISPGLRGLFIVALLAAAMSTFSPTVNLATAQFTRDLYQGFVRRSAGTKELIYASYAFGIFITVCSFLMAYTVRSINDIWDWIIMGLLSGITLPTMFRLYWWRFNAGGVVIGTAVGLVAALVQRALYPDLGPIEKFCIVTAIALAGTILGTYLTPPTDRRILENFYRTTRPFGFWGPLRNAVSPEALGAIRKEHFHDIVSLPFALLWQVTLFLWPMQMIIGAWRDFAITCPVFAASLIALYFLWYRHLPPAAPPTEEPSARRREPGVESVTPASGDRAG